ncbi:hypothetical protein WT97_23450 [Burkholderia sp. MSMB1459WGS]|uniref:hypothetical protein n=1 Tax=Burkholderia sp. MSMB1459WGS TaxID=1637970 RepID=UPI00075F7B47|nr:hypothetical protein [Burkholderia sp. MSMB1459WGS]KWO39047.1 hypothetical protein WT97_23450 [Burkholderia sp. MSMB1459WGS]
MTPKRPTACNAWQEIPKTDDPREFLASVMAHPGIAMEDRIEAAKALMPYYHEPLSSEDDRHEL